MCTTHQECILYISIAETIYSNRGDDSRVIRAKIVFGQWNIYPLIVTSLLIVKSLSVLCTYKDTKLFSTNMFAGENGFIAL
jgi:hypothetical protein